MDLIIFDGFFLFFFVENGIALFLWVGLQVDPNLLQQVFGVTTIGQVDIEMVSHFLIFERLI
jgi:hypothetical protein